MLILMRNVAIFLVAIAAPALCVGAQAPSAPSKEPGIPPRATPGDYQFHGPVGKLTLAAEFTGHAVGTPEGPLTTDDYVVVEAAVFGPAGARATLAASDFSLRVNRKKPIPADPYGLVVRTLRDLSLEPTAAEQKSSKTSIGSGGQGDSSPPPPYRVPDATRHEWSQRLAKASMPEGDRALPVAGLIYFPYHGKTEKIQSVELIYNGPAGKGSLALQ
jgi:hypothetical protein